ncbi:MAG: hypothetical protein L6R28_08520 [Planctomycetes bacterium]|nr:hypothetical protein [Planctomycetota bacterium]
MSLDASEITGRAIAVVILSGIAVAPLVVARRSKNRSERLACYSVFAGLSAFAFPEQIFTINAVDHAWVYYIDGLVRLPLALAGIVWCIMALRARKTDQGAGYVGPIVGGLFSIFHLILAMGVLLVTYMTNYGLPTAPPATANVGIQPAGTWSYEVSDCGFTMQLPSENWREEKAPTYPGKTVGEFTCSHYFGTRLMVAVQPITDDADIALIKRTAREKFIKEQHLVPKEQDGTFANGTRFTFFWAEGQDPNTQANVCGSLGMVWLPGQNLCVKLISDTMNAHHSLIWGRAAAARHRKLALWIAESVKSTVSAGQAEAGAD